MIAIGNLVIGLNLVGAQAQAPAALQTADFGLRWRWTDAIRR